MASESYVIGQRYISSAEKELGLGIVLDSRDRRVTVSFPACGEQRTYADKNAPLTRVRYDVGDTVRDIDDRTFTVLEVIEEGHNIYVVKDDAGKEMPLSEVELDPFVHFSGPLERLLAGNLDKPKQFQLRLDTLSNARRLQASGVAGLLGPRVDHLPHQVFIGNEVANRYAPRVLLADEVGLGKTIEAGLIIHHQLHNQRAQRVLIAAPDSLIHQWLVEMLRRFNLRFSIMDKNRLADVAEAHGGNPFESAQLILCPISVFDDDLLLALACDCPWDILCVDEAHHLQWSPEAPSQSYLAIEALSNKAHGLLLLTATPEQLGLESHFARLRLLDPARYHDLDAFIAEEEHYQSINQLVQELLASDGPDLFLESESLQAQLAGFLGQDSVNDLLQTLPTHDHPKDAMLAKIRQLLDRHGTGRVLFRNTRNSVSGFPKRCLNKTELVLPHDWSATSLYPELDRDEQWLEVDPRVEWLLTLLKSLKREKVLLITAHAETALSLEAFLTLRKGIRASVFHEHLSLLERDRSAAYFADQESGAQLLICSEIGSEGRNFQFAHHLVLFDLPANPDLLEQRIGRLDRIGQRSDVTIHTPYFANSCQAVLLDWYHEGLNAFEHTCPIGGAVRAQFKDALEACLASPTDEPAKLALIQETSEFRQQLLDKLQAGRDRLLELNSCDPHAAATTISAIEEASAEQALQDYMMMAFDQFGVDHQDHSDQSYVLHPTESMHSPFPELPEDGLSVCFNREKSLSREELAFISWEHPMVTATMDMVTSGDHGNASLCTIKLPPLPAGSWLLEAVYVLHCPAPKGHQLNRFLPATPIRVLLDQSGKNLAGVIAGHQLTQLAQKIPKHTARDITKHLKQEVQDRIGQAKTTAEKEAGELQTSARQKLDQEQTQELERLEALAQVNPNIRQEEIEHLREQNLAASRYLEQVQLRLDAIRVIVVT